MSSELQQAALLSEEQAHRAAVNGRLEEAATLYEQLLTLQRDLLGSSHPEVAATLHGLAVVHEAMGSTDQAQALWAEARTLLEP